MILSSIYARWARIRKDPDFTYYIEVSGQRHSGKVLGPTMNFSHTHAHTQICINGYNATSIKQHLLLSPPAPLSDVRAEQQTNTSPSDLENNQSIKRCWTPWAPFIKATPGCVLQDFLLKKQQMVERYHDITPCPVRFQKGVWQGRTKGLFTNLVSSSPGLWPLTPLLPSMQITVSSSIFPSSAWHGDPATGFHFMLRMKYLLCNRF